MEHIKGMYYKPEGSFEELPRGEQVSEYIRSFKEPALNICRQLQEAFSSGRYSQIFGVDASGRIPTLIVYEFAKATAKKQNVPAPVCHFLSPIPSINRKMEIIKQLKSRQEKAPILVIDDTIRKGTSIADATEIFRAFRVPFDVAIFIAYNLDAKHLAMQQEYIQAGKLYIGIEDYLTDGAFDNDEPKYPIKDSTMNGVERLVGPLHFGSQETIIPGDEMYQEDVNSARKVVSELAKEIFIELANANLDQ